MFSGVVHKSTLKGTDADLGSVTNEKFVSAHYGGGLNADYNSALCLCDGGWSLANNTGTYGGRWKIYRCVKPALANHQAGDAIKGTARTVK